MRKLSVIVVLSLLIINVYSQTGTWSGKVDVQGVFLTVVFHLDETNCTFDSPDQGVKGILAESSHSDTGSIVIKIPSIGRSSKEPPRIIKSLEHSPSKVSYFLSH